MSGHAAKGHGVNAISATFTLINELKEILESEVSPELGCTRQNLAYILGGQEKESSFQDGYLNQVGQAGNVVPNVCECVIDIRPANPQVTAAFVQKQLTNIASKYHIEYEIVHLSHDYSAWITPKTEIKKILPATETVNWSDPNLTGYLDLQMMWQQYNQPTAFMFGGGLGETAHSSDERIPINNFQKTVEFFSTLVEILCK
jgi:acetylornithine deacetylase/succinyl-diaminopimelate desuccinylase-like protein